MDKHIKIPGIMIAGVKSGSGKTTIACGLLKIFKEMGLQPSAFKCGPDYIDTLFHRRVIGVPSNNLDSYFAGPKQIQDIFAQNAKDSGIAVVEAAMGLYDGIGGTNIEGSAYEIASILNLPVILVVDAHGMGCSVLPLLSGFLSYDSKHRIAGVILNRISKPYFERIAPLIESELAIAVFGYMVNDKDITLKSRHLGLCLPGEVKDMQLRLQNMAGTLCEGVEVDRLLDTAKKKAVAINPKMPEQIASEEMVNIGIAYDEAFCFYYEENFRLLREYGANLVFFSPLYDRGLPKDMDAVIIGGGYPELYAGRLEENISMRQSVKKAIEDNMPSLAECGGFMYLHDTLEDDKGNRYKMCGVLPESCYYTGKSVRFGYMELSEKNGNFMKAGGTVKGHEFHYYDSTDSGRDCTAVKPATGKNWDCVYADDNHFWGFPHLYYLSNPDFIRHFIMEARLYKMKRMCYE